MNWQRLLRVLQPVLVALALLFIAALLVTQWDELRARTPGRCARVVAGLRAVAAGQLGHGGRHLAPSAALVGAELPTAGRAHLVRQRDHALHPRQYLAAAEHDHAVPSLGRAARRRR